MSMPLDGAKRTNSEMNVTPLIDVLLVLLIIFMVLPHHRGEKAEIPQSSTDSRILRPDDIIVIHLLSAGDGSRPSLKINREQVAAEVFEKRLKEVFQTRIDKVAFLKGDPDVDFRYVAEVIDTAHRAGVERVGLMGKND